MSDMIDTDNDFSGLEKMNYARFQLAYTVRRPGQAPTKFDDWSTFQFPNGSVVHTVNGFDTLVAPNEGLPDPKLPPMLNEKLPVYLMISAKVAGESAQPFGVKESYSFRASMVSSHIGHFIKTNPRYHRIISDRVLRTMSGVLTWVDYSPLNEIRVNGTLHAYRKFDIIFRTILDSVITIGSSKHHYILLPQSDRVFQRAIIQRTFKDLSTNTLNAFLNDPSMFPLLHILGFVYGKTHDLNVAPYKEDVKILGKDNDLFGEVKSSSLLERISPDMMAAINFVFYKDNRAVVYNLADLARFAEDSAFYPKLYRHFMNLRLISGTLPDHIDPDSEQFDEFVSDASPDKVEPTVVDQSVPVAKTEPVVAPTAVVSAPVVKAAPKEEHSFKPTAPSKASFEDRLRTAAIAHTESAVIVEPKKASRRDQLIEGHLKATLNGKPLGELIQPLETQLIAPKAMPFVTSAPEASYQQSSLLAMDRTYQAHAYHHDLAKVVGSLGKHGMFITKIDEEKTHTEMDRTTTFKIGLADIAGKTHNVRFTVPDIDHNSTMKLSGVEYRLTRQIANIPICKISPTRVNLSSYYNKIIVERIQSKRFSYEQDIAKLIGNLRTRDLLTATAGAAPYPTRKVAYDYTAVGRNFTEITVSGYDFMFSGDRAPYPEDLTPKLRGQMPDLEREFGAYVGNGPERNQFLFWNVSNQIHLVEDGKALNTWTSFHHLLVDRLGADALPGRTPLEWTQANIINQTIPLVYILAYRLGLKAVLEMIGLDYRFYTNRNEVETDITDIVVPMADGTLVFNRYPLSRSLIACGLLWVDLKKVSFRDMSVPDTYAGIFDQKGMSVGVLKGLSGFFDFFVDPITESVLEKMHEPITFHELLLRANVMLTDYHAEESSSVGLHRFRLYERFNGIIYNEIARALVTHRNNPSAKKGFSINPEAVFQKIVQDATVSPNEVINPVHEVKQRANVTFTGSGGRTPNSFILKDRIYPKDGIGIISDAVPDSGKVGITAYLSASPRIDDIHGIPTPYKDGDALAPPQILSIGSMVMPGGTTDDGKRNSYLSIQISHSVPNHNHGSTLSVRTGYDAVLPHLSSSTFATAAEDNGVVLSIDTKQNVLKVRYADRPAASLRNLKLPYLDSVLDAYRREHKSFGFLVPDTEIGNYPMGGVFALTKTTYGRVVDRLRCDTIDAIPDKDVGRKQNTLIQEFMKNKYAALYFIRFNPISNMIAGEVKSYSFADIYSQNSGSYLLQKRLPNVKEGDAFKTGDILIYNPGFFVPEPLNKQVTFKHGVIATVALVEKSSNHEDACEVSRELSNKLEMTPCHQREVETKSDAVILNIVQIGDQVETSDSLCVISDDYLVGSSTSLNIENLDIAEKLNRQTPSAGYTGRIRKIRILYGCDRERLSDSLKAILKTYEKEARDTFKAINTDPTMKPPEKPGWVAPGTKYLGIDFTDTTVVLEFMIEETLGVSEGDKICIGNANKSIVSYVNERQHFTESNVPIDVLFSTTSVINRIVSSPLTVGMAERNMEALKAKALDLYFS
jgi:hypothetical protein